MQTEEFYRQLLNEDRLQCLKRLQADFPLMSPTHGVILADLRTRHLAARSLHEKIQLAEDCAVFIHELIDMFSKTPSVSPTENADEANSLNESHLTYFNEGVDYGKAGNYSAAIKSYTKALAIKPDYAYAYIGRGMTYYDQDEYQKAIQDFNEAILIDENYAYAYITRGVIYGKLGEYQKAIQNFNKAILLNENDAGVYNCRGTTYYKLGEYEKALRDYDKALEIDPDYAKAINNRKDCLEKMRR